MGFELLAALVEAGYLLVVVGGDEDLDGAGRRGGCLGLGRRLVLGGEGLQRRSGHGLVAGGEWLRRRSHVAGGPLGGVEDRRLHRVVVHAVVDGASVVHLGVNPILLVHLPLLKRRLLIASSILLRQHAARGGNT